MNNKITQFGGYRINKDNKPLPSDHFPIDFFFFNQSQKYLPCSSKYRICLSFALSNNSFHVSDVGNFLHLGCTEHTSSYCMPRFSFLGYCRTSNSRYSLVITSVVLWLLLFQLSISISDYSCIPFIYRSQNINFSCYMLSKTTL